LPLLQECGGSIVSKYNDGTPGGIFSLSFLGLLLSTHGPDIENLLINSVLVMKKMVQNYPDLTVFSEIDVDKRLQLHLTDDQVAQLGKAFSMSPFIKSYSPRTNENKIWSIGIPDNLEDLPDDYDSLEKYLHEFVLKRYDPNKPLDPLQTGVSTNEALNKLAPNKVASNEAFIDSNRIEALKSITSEQFDLKKLVEICEELNFNYSNEKWLAVAALTRALIDHIPPIFEQPDFPHVANNYPFQKSIKETMQHLENSCRKIADSHLHGQIRKKESLPTKTQVNFSHDVDVLLSEIIRVLS
jgi:hypothetical protein